jgi:hypothetical protein
LEKVGVSLDLFAKCSLGDASSAVAALRTTGEELVGVHGLPVLHFAVVSRDSATVRKLLAAGAAVNSRQASLPPLHSAVAYEDMATIELLLRAGADVLATDPFAATALDWAIHLIGEGSPQAVVLRQCMRDTPRGVKSANSVRIARRLGS